MKTYREILQEGVVGIKRKEIPKIPGSGKAIEKKILKEDPWRRGEELAYAVTKAWPRIMAAAKDNENVSDFVKAVSELPEIQDFGKKQSLSPYHVADTIMKYFP